MQIAALQKKTTTSLNSNNQLGTAILPAVLVYQRSVNYAGKTNGTHYRKEGGGKSRG